MIAEKKSKMFCSIRILEELLQCRHNFLQKRRNDAERWVASVGSSGFLLLCIFFFCANCSFRLHKKIQNLYHLLQRLSSTPVLITVSGRRIFHFFLKWSSLEKQIIRNHLSSTCTQKRIGPNETVCFFFEMWKYWKVLPCINVCTNIAIPRASRAHFLT